MASFFIFGLNTLYYEYGYCIYGPFQIDVMKGIISFIYIYI